MRSLTARAPTRIDFGGGWTDVPPYTHEQGGFVCNVAISRYATVRLSGRTDGDPAVDIAASGDSRAERDPRLIRSAARRAGIHGIRIGLHSDFPFGAGLGGSSAAGVALAGALAAWRGEALDAAARAERSRSVEVEDLGVPGGFQDHYAASFGGALALRFDERTHVALIQLDDAMRRALERRCIVAFTGESRISGETITAVLDAYRDRVPRVVNALARMKALAESMAAALEHGSVDELAGLVGEHWEHQRSLHPKITTERIDEVMRRARDAGAAGGKALGASGGGCVVLIAHDGREEAVRAAVAGLTTILEYRVDEEGFRVVEQAA
jgi:D-glycero-alpha-D-manno-heptose-7-phosphate kinase